MSFVTYNLELDFCSKFFLCIGYFYSTFLFDIVLMQICYKLKRSFWVFPTNTPYGFHVEMTWSGLFHIVSAWNPSGVFVGKESGWEKLRKEITEKITTNRKQIIEVVTLFLALIPKIQHVSEIFIISRNLKI